MDCTAAILKLCARSRSKWSRHKRSPHRPWRRSDGRCCVGGGLDASSLVRRALIYACCCRPGEETSELCPEWEDRPVGGGGRGQSVEEEEGESELLFIGSGGSRVAAPGRVGWRGGEDTLSLCATERLLRPRRRV